MPFLQHADAQVLRQTSSKRLMWTLYCIFVLTSLFSGYHLELIGRLFLGDGLVALGAMVYLVAFRKIGRLPGVLLAMCVFPYIGVLFDAINQTPDADLVRGVARGTLFACAGVTGFVILKLFGVRAAVVWASIFMVGLTLSSIASGTVEVANYTRVVKFYGGSAAPMVIMLCAYRYRLLQCITAVCIGVFFITTVDARGAGVLWLAAGVAAAAAYFSARLFVRWIYVALIAASIATIGFANFILDERGTFAERRILSNSQRLDMLSDAWSGFKDRPLTGWGSWQHARSYMDPHIGAEFVGVHSYLIQFGYEYGIAGIGFWLFVLGSCMIAYKNWIASIANGERSQGGMFIVISYMLLYVILGIVNSPFAGFARLSTGVFVGILVAGRWNVLRSSALKR